MEDPPNNCHPFKEIISACIIITTIHDSVFKYISTAILTSTNHSLHESSENWIYVILLQCNFTKNNIPLRVFFTIFKLYKWYQIAQNIIYIIFKISGKENPLQKTINKNTCIKSASYFFLCKYQWCHTNFLTRWITQEKFLTTHHHQYS